ncbi:NUDIX domain-containing protein [Clostridium sp. CF011]|uniref:NUDIX hydrolase n=1 Tax=Clostridium sp. CF011 TaxID=2843318 RepID=UPI001C0C9386|nr:NUDIX domain-containing protein [Clostridium sp. CF011]MBU3093769.1 NUDIX domain-containing protein [Clostridium sp. CF011]WAG71227.1 NUDIX domain-containing protein [Clostridium sp. CF011]
MDGMDLTFKTEQGKFNYRVGAIILHDNKLLMVKNNKAPYFYSVGGRVKLHESAEEAVVREVYEETGIYMKIERLGFIHENFFTEDVTKERFHELSFFFYMKDMDSLNTICMSFTEDGAKEELQWIPLGKISDVYLYPEFFKEKLLNPLATVEHILTKEW